MEIIKVALIGNPNTGKTSIFNYLTGLQQKVGNYPGVTIDKKVGNCRLTDDIQAKILDLPGLYSLHATSIDEAVVTDLILNPNHPDFPDVIIVISNVENLKRNLLLFTQVKELEIPTLLAINMVEHMPKRGITIDVPYLETQLQTKIIQLSARKKQGFGELKSKIIAYDKLPTTPCIRDLSLQYTVVNKSKSIVFNPDTYRNWLQISRKYNPDFKEIAREEAIREKAHLELLPKKEIKLLQHKEAVNRYRFLNPILQKAWHRDPKKGTGIQERLDTILTHKVWGYLIFFSVLFLVFQSVFYLSSYPMDWIDLGFQWLGVQTKTLLPSGIFNDLLCQGILPGLGGVLIFIPQIALLFLLLGFLEESGYMSRVVFLMDRFMRKFGLSGKSVIPLISGTACAIPAIMATRNIENAKERLIATLVIPFTTCAARLPVYLILISVVIPDQKLWGLFSYQGITLLALYLLGFCAAIGGAWLLHHLIKMKNSFDFILEMPRYKVPVFKNLMLLIFLKTKSFIIDAGKIIVAFSILLWVLASYGPTRSFYNAEVTIAKNNPGLTQSELELKIAAYELENSFLGYTGKFITPLVAPLGYDWKIGIGILSSFAAREVFVGTLSTIYSIGSDNTETIQSRIASEINPETGKRRFNLATGVSLLLFYAFAMQCISTLAIVKRETNSYIWAIGQWLVMGLLAYFVALLAYQILEAY